MLASIIWKNQLVSNNLFWQMWIYVCSFMHTYILGLTNGKYVMRTYICSLHLKAKLSKTERETDGIKHRELYHTFFLLNGAVWKKQDHSLQSSVWVQIKNISFYFWYSFEKCFRYAIVINKARNQFSFFKMHHEKIPVT